MNVEHPAGSADFFFRIRILAYQRKRLFERHPDLEAARLTETRCADTGIVGTNRVLYRWRDRGSLIICQRKRTRANPNQAPQHNRASHTYIRQSANLAHRAFPPVFRILVTTLRYARSHKFALPDRAEIPLIEIARKTPARNPLPSPHRALGSPTLPAGIGNSALCRNNTT